MKRKKMDLHCGATCGDFSFVEMTKNALKKLSNKKHYHKALRSLRFQKKRIPCALCG